jgi:polysaccharide pyruvyl transferase WcaK-like protein
VNALLAEFVQAPAPEITFLDHLHAGIHRARQGKSSRILPAGSDGRVKFNPLLLGYNGASNTGADVRVIEMLRQFKHVFQHVDFEPVLFASGQDFSHPAFNGIEKLHATAYFPEFLAQVAETHSGIIACEGSMFTSTFSDSLTGMFAGGIGHAAALGHLAVGYGAEAAKMSPALESFVQSACQDTLVIARNNNSLAKLHALGIRAQTGADPAWTFEPALEGKTDVLRASGWNGTDPVAVLCPINPFCWPIVVDIERAKACHSSGQQDAMQYNDISFHSWSDNAAQKYDAYLACFAELIAWLRNRHYFPVLVGMQNMDRSSCERLNQLLPQALPVFVRGSYDIDDITGLLHRAKMIVTSRFHAAVIGMAGATPCIGVSMDSRIDSLFTENGLAEWLLSCDTRQLGAQLIERANSVENSSDALIDCYGRLTAKQIRLFGQMGIQIMQEAVNTYQNFPPSNRPETWDAYLPPLSSRVEKLLNRYA